MNNALKADCQGKKREKGKINFSAFLSSLNRGSELFKDQSDHIPFQEYLDIISPVSSADRTNIFLNHTGASGEKLISHISEWCSPESESESNNPELQNLPYDKFLSRWYDIFSEGSIINGKLMEFPPGEILFLKKRGIKNILIVPLFSCGEFKGFIEFDKCFSSNEWEDCEVEYVKAVAQNLSHMIERDWVFSRLQSENILFNTVSDAMDVAMAAIDYETYEVLYMNKYALDKFGEGLGRTCWNVFYEDKNCPCSFCGKEKLISEDGHLNAPYVWEHYFPKIDQWCMVSSQVMKWTDGKLVIFETLTDISNLKKSENMLRKSIDEKDSLLNEVHHRVKNNLQSLVYLISMQSDYIDNSKAEEILKELKERVNAMSLVHSQLYQSSNLASIDFEKYVSDLLNTLIRSLAMEKIDTNVKIKGIFLDIKTAIPCGLVINELVTNIIKHAFNDKMVVGNSPEIKISMESVNERYILKVGDNGKGFKMPVNFVEQESHLGLKLVKIWATHQLRGTLDVNEKSGVEFVITFPEK